MRRRRPPIPDLPEPHVIVLLTLMDDLGGRATWEQLRDAVAAKGIGEHELHLIVYGRPPAGGA